MENYFKHIEPSEISDNIFKAIGNDWMLITAGNPESWNTMTASWGTLGILWNLPIAICFIRPQRYTFTFTEKSSFYTLSFFEEEYRDALRFCGSRSGRDYDKARETGLTVHKTSRENVTFKEARLVLECRKLYSDDLKPGNFIFKELINRNYPRKDFHRFYIGEVVNVYLPNKSEG